MAKYEIFMGFEVGSAREVKIPLFHLLLTGQTQRSGKTTLLKALIVQAVQLGFKVLLFDTKQNFADYSDFGQEIPICLRETTDALTILGLLESIMQSKLKQQYATLTRVTEGAKTLSDVIANAKKLEEETRVGFVKDACRTLADLMQRLLDQTKERETTPNLTLPYSINRLTLNEFSSEGQQMIVKTAFEDALMHEGKVIVVLDEASRFLPQRYRSACMKAIQNFVTQGAITNKYMFMATQFLATTSKDAMKAMGVKVLGRQDHITECEHTLDLIPYAGGDKLTPDNIMTLKLGHFIVVADNWVRTVYACPDNADKNECKRVAIGSMEPERIHYRFLLTQEDVEKLGEKKTRKSIVAPVKPVEQTWVSIPDSEESETIQIEKPEQKKPQTPVFKPPQGSGLNRQLELMNNNIESIRLGLKDVEAKIINSNIETIRLRLKELETKVTLLEKPPVVNSKDTSLTLTETHTEISIQKETVELQISDKTNRGKILTLAKEGFFKEYHPLREVVNALEEHHWTVNTNTIKLELYDMAKDRLLSTKIKDKTYMYILPPNVTFAGEPKSGNA